jgi:hypothetical protein
VALNKDSREGLHQHVAVAVWRLQLLLPSPHVTAVTFSVGILLTVNPPCNHHQQLSSVIVSWQSPSSWQPPHYNLHRCQTLLLLLLLFCCFPHPAPAAQMHVTVTALSCCLAVLSCSSPVFIHVDACQQLPHHVIISCPHSHH